jgi:hypothetical protein
MLHHLSTEDNTQEPNHITSQENSHSTQHHLHITLHILLALSLAFRYFFAKSLLPYSFELDFAQTFPIQNKLSQSNFFSLEQLDLRLWPLIGFSICLWAMIGLFNNKIKKAWVYIILIHAIPLMDVFGVMGSPWTGGVCCWIFAWRLHIRPFKNTTIQSLALTSIGFISFWWSSLNFYLWPWLLYSFFSYLNLFTFKSWGKYIFYIYLIIYQLFSLYLMPEQHVSDNLNFIFDLWPIFLGPVAIISSLGFFLLWCLKMIFRNDSNSLIIKELGILCFLMVSAILMHRHTTDTSIEALIILAFLVPFGLLYGPRTQIGKWSVNLSYWTTLSFVLLILLAPTIKENFSKSSFKADMNHFESWHINERISQDLALRFWQVIEPHNPEIILCQNSEMALQMQRYSSRTCITIEKWHQLSSKEKDDFIRVFILSDKAIPLKDRIEWFGKNIDWFLHKQWTLTLNIEDIHTFFVYGSTSSKSSILVF